MVSPSAAPATERARSVTRKLHWIWPSCASAANAAAWRPSLRARASCGNTSRRREPTAREQASTTQPKFFAGREAARAIGFALSQAVSLLNPGLIVLGGDLVSAEDLFIPVIREEMRRLTLPLLLEDLQIKASSLGLDIRLEGAASLAFRHAIADPELLAKLCRPAVGSREARLSARATRLGSQSQSVSVAK